MLMMLEAVFWRLLLPLLPLFLITIQQYCTFNKMFSSRKRNQSLKNLSATQTANWQEPLTQRKLTKVVLPTIAEKREVQRMQAKELSLNINKFKHCLTKNDTSQDDLIRNAYYVIKNFGEVESNFRDVFAGLHGKIKDFIFINDTEICIAYKINEGTTYKKSIKVVDKINREIIATRDATIASLQVKMEKMEQSLKAEILDQSMEISKLKVEVERYKQLADTAYVLSLEKKVSELKETIASQEEQYQALAKKNEQISHELLQTRVSLQNQQIRCSDLQAKLRDMKIDNQRLEMCLLKIKERFQQLSSRMEGVKDIIQKVEAQNETLVSERMKLINRAAVTFQELTPRPKYSNYFAYDPSTYLKPSKEIFQYLFNELPPNRQQFCQKYFLSKKNRKLLECQAIRQQTIAEVNNSTAHINRLMNS